MSTFRFDRAVAILGAMASEDSGHDVVEYGLTIAAIAVVILLGTSAFGKEIRPWFEFLAGRITTTGT